MIGAIDLARFEDDPDRTLYVLDVRDPAEYRAGHRPGSRSAPGGQLVQATDQWIGVRDARIVLVDDTGVRARMAGGVAAPDGPSRRVRGGRRRWRRSRATGARACRCRNSAPTVPMIDVTGLVALLDSGDAHAWCSISRAASISATATSPARCGASAHGSARCGRSWPAAQHVVVTSPDGIAGRLAVPEVQAADRRRRCACWKAAPALWHAFGRPLVQGPHQPAGRGLHRLLPPSPTTATPAWRRRCSAYLTWEIDLVDQISARRHGGIRCWRGIRRAH